ncbi:carbohydrate esterase family 5 protein [Purpureocillium lilacinum]|uniref:Carbohydrate esterase family 5 protein n=1 Tax=Purpureocillium lilacinum TaxID=33203 RepID=A0A2U3EAW1_PURLI|nr:carbohydrate esterase family 5 protein [Purpureocillium lilacinum]
MKHTLGLVVCIAQLATANAFFSFNRRAECAKGLYILYARGTGEPQDTGMTHGISVDIAKRIPGSKVVPVVYPATFTAPPYQDSVADGVKNMQEGILQYAKDCPDGKMALLGYSQGAHVTMDSVCGGSGGVFDKVPPIPEEIVKKSIVAMVVFGDPTHTPNVTYNTGSSINSGFFERSNASIETCERYSSRLISYCDTGDTFCDSGDIPSVHTSYIKLYGDKVIKYVVDRYNSASNNNTSQSSTSMPGSATGTSTDAASSTTAATATDNNRATATSAGPSSAVDTTTASAVSSAVSSVATASGTANTTSSPSPSVVHSGSSRLEAVSALRMALIAMGLLVWGMMAQG